MNLEKIGSGLGRIPSGVFVLAAPHGSRMVAMMTSFVQQVGFDPPLVVVAVREGRPILKAIDASKSFALSVLGKNSRNALQRFWKGVPDGQDPFEGLDTLLLETKIPILREGVGFLECSLHSRIEAGDHLLYIGKVINGGRFATDEPMVRVRTDGFDY